MRNESGAGSFDAWIDLARWVAAACVLVTHIGIRMLVPVADMPAFSLPHAVFAFFAGFDHQAVMVFFVISGLLVGGSVVREILATGQIAMGAYVGRRLVRLWLVLLPAFALGAGCIAVAVALGGVKSGVLRADIGSALSPSVLLCNAAFLQTAACTQFAGNGALWSLFNEFWYYLLFPPLALALFSQLALPRRIMLGVLALAALAGLTAVQFTGSPIGPYMLVWGVGVGAATLPRPVIRRPWVAAALFAAASLVVRLAIRRSVAGLHPLLSAELDLVLALLFGNLLLTVRCDPALRRPPWPRLHQALAGFSFSLYCTHIPVLALYITALVALTGTGAQMSGTGVGPWMAVGGGLALCLGVGWGFARLTEAQTARVRSWLSRTWPSQLTPAR